MKNKKGFSLVELLIVIAIIGILAGIAIPSVMRYLKNSRAKYNESLNTELVSFTKSYYSENKNELPRGYLDDDGLPINRTLLGASSLLNNNYITGEFLDSEGNDCTNNSYVIVEKNGDDYKYTPCVVCDNGYKSDDTNCIYEAPKTSGNIKDNVAPRCSFTLKSGVLNKWTSESVVFNFLAEDNEELAGISLNNGNMFSVSGKKFSFDVTFNETGTVEGYTATVDDKNAARRTCTIDGKIMIDKDVPVINSFDVTSNHKSGDTKNVTVEIKATDSHSGVDKVCITNSNDSSTCTWVDMASDTYTNDDYNIVVTDSDSTTVTIYAFVKDKVGNISDVYSKEYTLYEYCTETTLKTSSSWSSCSVSCGKGTRYKTEYYVDKYYPDVSCGDSKVIEECSGSTCYMCYSGAAETTYVWSKSGYASFLYGNESFQIMEYTTSCPVKNWKGCYIIKSSVNLKNGKRNGYFDGVSGYSGTYYGYVYPTCVNISGGTCACNPGSSAVSTTYSSAAKGTCYTDWSAWSSFAFGYTSRQSSTTLKQWSCVQTGSNIAEYKCRYRTRTSYSC